MIIYKITNKINGKIYIGLTTQKLLTRFNHHIYESKNGSNSYFHRALLKYSRDNFIVEELDRSDNIDDLKSKEVFYINKFNSYKRDIGYNINKGGDFGTLGYKHSKESIEKRLKSLGKFRHSEESKLKMSKSRIGKQLPPKLIEAALYRNKLNSKVVLKIDSDLNIVSEYKSVLSAAKENQINPKSLSRGLNNKRGFFKKNNYIYKFKN